MKRYQFRLERLLEIRKYRELEWELKLAAVTGECVRLKNEIDEMDISRRMTLAQRFDIAGLDMAYLTASEHYMRRLDAHTRADQQALIEKERERDRVREDYLSVSRDRKVLDSLKEKRAAVYRREQLKEEILQVDDMSGSTNAWKSEHR
ncbi:MAG TPA: flagellar export protein FliJ [Spirochaetia bacterium]|nr:flagellar export protein FliJ [Spirochaetia bacterium]